MRVRIKDREWFEENCYKDISSNSYHHNNGDLMFFFRNNKLMGNIIETSNFPDICFELWMYDIIEEEKPKRKVIQISATDNYISLLCDDGSVYKYSGDGYFKLPPIPEV